VAGIVAPGLRALLCNLIDYAGMFPPASLPREEAIARYGRHRRAEHAWMLGRFVISAEQVDEMPQELDGCFAVLSDVDHPRCGCDRIQENHLDIQADLLRSADRAA
jgi:hypothetical protein